MANCKHLDVRINTIISDGGDIEQTICANEDCKYILKEEQMVERADGTSLKRARPVKPESQPEGFEFKDKNLVPPEERLLSAQEMLALAIETRENTIGKQARELAKVILEECAKHVLLGEYTHCITEGTVSGEIVTLTYKELKAQGYRVKKTPEPGVGTQLNIKWPIKLRKKKGKKQDPEIKIGTGTGSPQPRSTKRVAKKAPKADIEIRKKQNARAKHREEALAARSKLPS